MDLLSATAGGRHRWLVFMHQIAPKPDYLRVKVRRRLQRLGAVALKNSVYVLPATPERVEDFHWLAREIEAEGGEAMFCEAWFIAGIADDQLIGYFRADSDGRYAEIVDRAASVVGAGDTAALARLRRRLAEAVRLDFFDAPGRTAAEAAIAGAEARLPDGEPGRGGHPAAGSLCGRTWVTRADVFVDRIASAWLIRRFVDPDARFRFVSAPDYRPAAGELRFDMFEGEFTHEGGRCTFEVLLDAAGMQDDPALVKISQIVHDIDLNDGRFGRPEASGVESLLAGIARSEPGDERRIERGAALFDALYAAFSPPAEA